MQIGKHQGSVAISYGAGTHIYFSYTRCEKDLTQAFGDIFAGHLIVREVKLRNRVVVLQSKNYIHPALFAELACHQTQTYQTVRVADEFLERRAFFVDLDVVHFQMGQFAQVVWFEEHFQVVVMDGIAGDVQRSELVPWFALEIIQQWRVLYPVRLKI